MACGQYLIIVINFMNKKQQQHFDIVLYCDGACSGNPGKGAYASIIKEGDSNSQKQFIKAFYLTTNNRMELLGVIEPLETLKKPKIIKVYTDSKYVSDSINKKWLNNWLKNNWRTANHKPVKNKDLWQRLHRLLIIHNITFHWIKGHNSNIMNDECDRLAIDAYNSDKFFNDINYEEIK